MSGISDVVAGSPYELRIAAGNPSHPMKATSVKVSERDSKAGVKIKILSQDGWKLRVLIESPVSRDAHWIVAF